MERFYSPAQVAERLSISKSAAYDLLHRRLFPVMEKPFLRVSERVLAEWLERNTVYPMARGRKAG